MSRPIGQWRAMAHRSPYILDLGDGDTIKVKWPTPDALLEVGALSAPADILMHLAGESATAMFRAVRDLDYQVVLDVLADMCAHFGCTRSRDLIMQIERYGEPISNDLQDMYGLDMLDVFRGTITPDLLLTRIKGLPRHSRWAEAMAQDDELAALPSDGEPKTRRITETEWTPEVEHLAIVADRLGAVIETIAGVVGGKVQIPSLPRPVGAAERLAERLDDQHYDEVTAAVEEAQRRWAELHPEEV